MATESKTNVVRRDLGLQSELVQLEAWAQEELAAQRALVQALELQEEAIRIGSTVGLLESTEVVQDATRKSALREKRRVAGMRALARRFGVAAETLTLTSIVERASAAGVDSSRLARARTELRDAAAEALKRGRRIASLAHHHRVVVDELFRNLAGGCAQDGSERNEDALVVDREA